MTRDELISQSRDEIEEILLLHVIEHIEGSSGKKEFSLLDITKALLELGIADIQISDKHIVFDVHRVSSPPKFIPLRQSDEDLPELGGPLLW